MRRNCIQCSTLSYEVSGVRSGFFYVLSRTEVQFNSFFSYKKAWPTQHQFYDLVACKIQYDIAWECLKSSPMSRTTVLRIDHSFKRHNIETILNVCQIFTTTSDFRSVSCPGSAFSARCVRRTNRCAIAIMFVCLSVCLRRALHVDYGRASWSYSAF